MVLWPLTKNADGCLLFISLMQFSCPRRGDRCPDHTFAPIIGYPQNPCNFSSDRSPQLCSRSFALFLASAAAASMLNFIIAAAAAASSAPPAFLLPFSLQRERIEWRSPPSRFFSGPQFAGADGRNSSRSLSLASESLAFLRASSHAFSRVNSPNYFAQFHIHSQRKM